MHTVILTFRELQQPNCNIKPNIFILVGLEIFGFKNKGLNVPENTNLISFNWKIIQKTSLTCLSNVFYFYQDPFLSKVVSI